jgi:glycerophosphoryl diester phosphodiesterase
MRALFSCAAILFIAMTIVESAAPKKILVHGHRGARSRVPENTIPAFEYAIQAGADFIELDLAVTKDNVLVVSHDPILHAPMCRGPREGAVIRELTFAEIQQWDCGALKHPQYPDQKPVPGTRMPSLDQVLGLASRGTFGFNIETKLSVKNPEYTPPPEEFARLVLEQIRKHGVEKRAIVQSFDFRTLRAMRRLAPEIRLAALIDKDERDFVTVAREAEADIIAPHYSLVTREKTAAAQRAGVPVVPWTANLPEQWEKLAEAGVDAIISDDPGVLVEWLKARGLR